MGKYGKILLLMVLALVSQVVSGAPDAESIYAEGRKLYLAGEYYDAATKFDESFFAAKSAPVRANSLLAQIGAYRMCGLYYREFQAIEKLLDRFPEYADCNALISREFQIAEMFRTGTREPAFWALRWIPWLNGPDRSIDMYHKVLARAPFAAAAPAARLRLAYLLDDDGKTDDAIEQLRLLIRDYPSSPQYKFALLGLGELLYKRSQSGDGDGRIAAEAATLLARFKKEFPNAPETAMAERIRLQAMDARAKQLLGTARFYARNDRSAAAAKYLGTILREYPDSQSAPEAERMLVELDEAYTPDPFRPEEEPRHAILPARRLPPQPMPLLVAPDNSNGKYLLPVYDLRVGRVEEENQK